jgi:hypothetical protein
MPRVLVISDQGELAWCERVRATDFETEHFRDCLNDRLRWAVNDAETCTHASLIPPLHPGAQMRNSPDQTLEPV